MPASVVCAVLRRRIMVNTYRLGFARSTVKNIMNFVTNLRKFTVGLCLILALAACAGSTPRATRPPPGPSIQVAYIESANGPAVDVTAVHALPLTSAELVSPAGRTTRAVSIDRDTTRGETSTRPDIGVGVFGGSRGIEGSGVSIGLPIGGFGQPPPPGPIRARTRIPIDDDASYRQNWRDYVVGGGVWGPPRRLAGGA
jgi:hypothetical protein